MHYLFYKQTSWLLDRLVKLNHLNVLQTYTWLIRTRVMSCKHTQEKKLWNVGHIFLILNACCRSYNWFGAAQSDDLRTTHVLFATMVCKEACKRKEVYGVCVICKAGHWWVQNYWRTNISRCFRRQCFMGWNFTSWIARRTMRADLVRFNYCTDLSLITSTCAWKFCTRQHHYVTQMIWISLCMHGEHMWGSEEFYWVCWSAAEFFI